MYDNYALQKAINEIHNALYDQIDEELRSKGVDCSDRSLLHIGDLIDKQIVELLKDVATQEAIQNKFKRTVMKVAMTKHRETVAKRKQMQKEGLEIWKLTQGKIPCMGGCGTTWQRTKNEIVYEGHCQTICAKCAEEHPDDHMEFFKRDIFDVIAGKYDKQEVAQ